ncbi:MAG: tail fiber domain-containing protein [Bdellovibrionales bacterium]|nr:tail fiber domain-containing protein [Bdellovibrionales bacterium]
MDRLLIGRSNYRLFSYLVALNFAGTLIFSTSLASEAPSGLVYQGRIMKPDNSPLEAVSVLFDIEVYSPDGACLLFEETHTISMVGSGGSFSLTLGTGTPIGPSYFVREVFSNTGTFTGAGSCSYSPSTGDSRRIRVTFDEGGGPVALQDQIVQSVPYALYASKLEGKGKSDFLQINTTTSALSQANANSLFQNATYTELLALAAGTSTVFAKSVDLPVSSGVLNLSGAGQGVRVLDVPAGGDYAVNKNYSDGKIGGKSIDAANFAGLANGESVKWDTTANSGLGGWVRYTPASTSGFVVNGGQAGAITIGANDAYGVDFKTNNITRLSLSSTGDAVFSVTNFSAGSSNTVTGSYSAAIGEGNTAGTNRSFAVGSNNTATNGYSVAMGAGNSATGTNSFAVGYYGTASGDYSRTIGMYSTAASYQQISLGSYNLPTGTENSSSWVGTDPLLVVGNGTGSGASRSNALMILKNGNVGIGSSSPYSNLHISHPGGTGLTNPAEFRLLNSTIQGSSQIILGETDSVGEYDGMKIRYHSTSDGLYNALQVLGHYTGGDTSVHLSIDRNNGYVGIGTSTPSEVLEVNGNVKATSFISTSDVRLKTDIQQIKGLSAILKLQGLQYRWKNTGEGDAGVLAQEVEKIFPDAVRTDPVTGYKGVKYLYLIAPLIESAKELYEMCKTNETLTTQQTLELASLKNENSHLKSKLENLEKRLQDLEKKLGIYQ